MKTPIHLLAGLAGLFAPAAVLCAATVDAEKEKAAVIAVIEEEKDAYLALDDKRMAATWIQQPSSLKLYVFDGKETRFEGYTAIAAHDRENLVEWRASLEGPPRPHVDFTDYHIVLQGDMAWVNHHARWEIRVDGTPMLGTQSRINVVQKENGRWKIALMAISQLTFEKAAAATTVAPTSNEQELINIEHAWAKAYVDRDVAALNRIMAAEWSFTKSDGSFLTKAEDLAEVSAGKYAPLAVEASAMQVRQFGDTAIVTGRWTDKVKKDGVETTDVYQFTDTFIRRDGRWQCVAGHGSVVPAVPTDIAIDEQELIRLEAVWTEGLRKADPASIDRLLADDYHCTDDSGGISTKAQDLARLTSGELKFTTLVTDDYRVRACGDTAVVTGRNTERSTYKGADTSGQYRWTDTWVKRDGRWQCVATHYSKVAQK